MCWLCFSLPYNYRSTPAMGYDMFMRSEANTQHLKDQRLRQVYCLSVLFRLGVWKHHLMVWCMTMMMTFLWLSAQGYTKYYVNDLCSCNNHLSKKQQKLNAPLSNSNVHFRKSVVWLYNMTSQPNDFYMDWIQYDANLWKLMCFTLRYFFSGSSTQNLYNLCTLHVKMKHPAYTAYELIDTV